MSMNKTWKEVEKKIAAYLTEQLGYKFERVRVAEPIPYDVVPEAEDGSNGVAPLLGIEAKLRKDYPAWFKEAIQQAQTHRKHPDTKVLRPAVVFAERRKPPREYVVAIRLDDLCALMRDTLEVDLWFGEEKCDEP